MIRTHIQYQIDEDVEVESSLVQLFRNHGLSNIAYNTRKDFVERLEQAISEQFNQQHIEIVTAVGRFWQLELELGKMFSYKSGQGYTKNNNFNLARAREIREEMFQLMRTQGLNEQEMLEALEDMRCNSFIQAIDEAAE